MSFKMEISENFSSYRSDIEKSISNLETEINSIAITLNSIDGRKNDRIESLIKESENNLKQLNVELSLMPATTKQKYSTLMNGYQEKIVKLRRTFYDLRLTRNKTSSNEDSNDPRKSLINVANKLDTGCKMIGESVKTMANIRETDKETMLTLKKQTELIKNSSGKLIDAEEYISRTDNVLNNMIKRVFTNKLVLFALVILLAFLNIFVLYLKLKYKILGIK